MSSLHLMFDAAFPPGKPYPGAQAVAGYIGGNTPHIWTLDEWLRFQHLVQFPIWVGFNEADPIGHANDAVAAMKRLGWSQNARNKRAVILDFETEIDPGWVNQFAGTINDHGYETMPYGSESTIVSNPSRSGRWVALYDGQMDIPNVTDAIGHQFRADVPWDGTQVDLSVITDTMYSHGGVGPRHG